MPNGRGLEGRSARLRICVGVATKGRPEQLEAMLAHLQHQTVPPDMIVVCATESHDVGCVASSSNVTTIYAEAGTCQQRNEILRMLPETVEWIVFFDDDFYPASNWLEEVDRTFRSDPSISSITGFLTADGIKGPGLTESEALRSIAAHDVSKSNWIIEGYSPYGCNMAFRCSAIRNLRFDENLVLYGWLEDQDFGAAIAKRGGRLVKLGTAFGAHLGIKRGRVSGRKFGYSQIVNPVYMYRKGTISFVQATMQIGRNVVANTVKSIYPEPYVDRRGRLVGNMIATLDLLRQRAAPQRAASL